jgi:hypothetical protein
MKTLLESTGEYEEICCVAPDSAAQTKNSMAAWFDGLRGQPVSEIFFYYTGHGEFYNDEFYFFLRDFDDTRRNATSLTNSEVDGWLRSLNADLTVKVIDACNSGVRYIKGGTEAIKAYFNSSRSGFNKCIFMFSSGYDQHSFQLPGQMSTFTLGFLEAVEHHQADVIRYRDIMDFIADRFQSSPKQTPFFVTQSDNTERFAQILAELRKAANQLIEKHGLGSSKELVLVTEPSSLKRLIEEDAKCYVSEEQALAILNQIKEQVEQYRFSEELSELYEVRLSFPQNYQSVPRLTALGQWLADNKHNFFAEPLYEKRPVKVEASEDYYGQRAFMFASGLLRPQYENVLAGVRLTFDLPYHVIRLVVAPRYPNTPYYLCPIVPLVSRNRIRFFYHFAVYEYKNWKDTFLANTPEWRSFECPIGLTDDVYSTVEGILTQFSAHVIQQLRERFLGASSAQESP